MSIVPKRIRLVPQGPTPCAGRRPDKLREDLRQMALICEARGERDVGNRRFGIEEQVLGLLDESLQEPDVRRLSGRLLEGAREMAARQPALVREFGHQDVALETV